MFIYNILSKETMNNGDKTMVACDLTLPEGHMKKGEFNKVLSCLEEIERDVEKDDFKALFEIVEMRANAYQGLMNENIRIACEFKAKIEVGDIAIEETIDTTKAESETSADEEVEMQR
jgi:hypothetical protein